MYTVGSLVKHKFRGIGMFTDQCKRLQELNPDPSSIFVSFEGEIMEVTAKLVTAVELETV